MKALKNITYIIAAGAVWASAFSCADFLDTVPDERMEINTPEKVSALLVNAYPNVSLAAILNTRCDNVTDFGADLTGSQPVPLFDFMGQNFLWRDVIAGGNDTFDAFWAGCYSAIAAANHALEAIEKLGGAEALPEQYGEALMARAFAHLYLVTLFSHCYDPGSAAIYPGIPYVEVPEDRPVQEYERKTVQYTYDKIEKDIAEGFPYMTDGGIYKAPAYHFTTRSAVGLACRFYLMKKDYNRVIEYANMLIPMPSQFTDVTDAEGKPVYNQDGTPCRNVSADDAASRFARGNFHPVASEYINMSSADDISAAFNSSRRKANLLITEATSSIAWSQSLYYQRYAMSRSDFDRTFLAANATGTGQWTYPVFGGDSPSGSYLFVPKYEKYYDQSSIDATNFIPYANIPVLRMEEVLLGRIEAFIMTDRYDEAIADMNVFAATRVTGDSGAYDIRQHCITRDKLLSLYGSQAADSEHYINKYNTVEGTDTRLKKALILALLNFREVEFNWEGLRWLDIVRWNIPVTHKTSGGAAATMYPDDDRRVLQLPESVQLSGLELNPRTNVGDVL